LVLDGRVDRIDEFVFADLAEGNSLSQRSKLGVENQLVAALGRFAYHYLRSTPAWNLIFVNVKQLVFEGAHFKVPVENEVDRLGVLGQLHIVDQQVAR
jgi:hypothetical protein